jgi:O-antigen/teichoic acid export membrane protein
MTRAAEPLMTAIGGEAFRPSGDVLRIQVAALLFITLYQIWGVALVALGRQRDLILTNGLALLGMACFAGVLVPTLDARGGAIATVLGDALLASLIYWRLHLGAGKVTLRRGFPIRVVAATAVAGLALIPGALPDLVAAAVAGAVFLGVGWAIGMVPQEVREMAAPLRRALRFGR